MLCLANANAEFSADDLLVLPPKSLSRPSALPQGSHVFRRFFIRGSRHENEFEVRMRLGRQPFSELRKKIGSHLSCCQYRNWMGIFFFRNPLLYSYIIN